MDRYGGSFGAHDDAFGEPGPFGADHAEDAEEHAPLAPPSPVGQDERRMQVRAYNHWAALLGNANFPDIADLAPETLDDFGPYGVLLDFGGKRGVDDPAIRFLGEKLAEECGGDAQFKRLSDVPGRSLLSRITDHYLQILANQAPIGFEAEFTNQRGAEVLYRGILLPWSSDGETIDFVFGVINWKELADAETAEKLLNAIDAALEAPIPPYEGKDMDRMLDLSGFAEDSGEGPEPVSLPTPAFGAPDEGEDDAERVSSPFDLVDEAGEEDEEDEDAGEATEWGAGFSGFGDEDTVYTVDYGDQGLEEGEEDEDFDGVVDPLADQTASLGLASLVSRSGRVKQSVVLPGLEAETPTEPAPEIARTTLEQRVRAAIPQGYGTGEAPASVTRAPVHAPEPTAEIAEDEPFELEQAFEEPVAEAEPSPLDLAREAFADEADEPAPAPLELAFEDTEPEGLYDCLAAARELAQTARSSEDRGRKALYQAVARAYDFSLEAAANPADFDELLVENGLTVQDRAPMTPIVKLVFGADYDKTRLTEYATVLGYAHRTGVARGTLDTVLAGAEGGLKGVVQAERQARKEAEGKPVAASQGVRNSLAKKLRKLDAVAFDDLPAEGAEFALVMVRRSPSGELVIVGEVPEDVALVEKAARKLLA
mgnify:CR=1 FL=1